MDFNKIKTVGLEYVEKGKSVAVDLTEKGKTQAKVLNEQVKLMKAQRQLGALVYNLAKGKEENQPLVDKYIDMIGSIEQEIEQLKAGMTPMETTEIELDDIFDIEEPSKQTVCPQCGAEVAADALFCNKCGAQL